jgi:branched-subunit amino acid ABC-type transport system permease component
MSATIMKYMKSLLVNLAEFGIIVVAASATILWYCVKRTRTGPAIRDAYFGVSEHLKRYKSQ